MPTEHGVDRGVLPGHDIDQAIDRNVEVVPAGHRLVPVSAPWVDLVLHQPDRDVIPRPSRVLVVTTVPPRHMRSRLVPAHEAAQRTRAHGPQYTRPRSGQ